MMGLKYCPECKIIAYTKVQGGGYKTIKYRNVLIKRRKVAHLEEDGGCGKAWYTYEVPSQLLPDLEPEKDE